MRSLLAFPEPVNERAARVLAAGVALASTAAIAAQTPWATTMIEYGVGSVFSVCERCDNTGMRGRSGRSRVAPYQPC